MRKNPSKADELKPEHERFCSEYILDDNGTRAYQRAYPNCGYNTARSGACNLIAKPNIAARIEELREARLKRLEISGEKILRRLEARASANVRDLLQEDGSFIPIHELSPDIAIAIKSVEYDSKGAISKIIMFDGKPSDELLGKNLKLWKEVGSVENPLTLEQLVTGRD